jgi:hypothetical protein
MSRPQGGGAEPGLPADPQGPPAGPSAGERREPTAPPPAAPPPQGVPADPVPADPVPADPVPADPVPADPVPAPVVPVIAVQPQMAPDADAALIIAIVGLVLCPLLGGVIALILAARGRQAIADSDGTLFGLRRIRLARTIAVISIAWGLVVLALSVLFFTPAGL